MMDNENSHNQGEDLSAQLKNLTVEGDGEKLKADLLRRRRLLLDELEQFEQYLVEQKKVGGVELRHFKNGVKMESNSLEKFSNANPSAQRILHSLRSSNLPFYAAVWDSAKRCTGIVALEKRFYWAPERHPNVEDDSNSTVGPRPCRYSALVDIVAQDGSEWNKVSTLTEKRLLFDMAKAGWVGGSSSEDSDADDGQDDEPEGLLKQAEALVKASKATRLRYRHPRVRVVLPKIKKGGAKEVDELIKQVEALGITVQTAEDQQEAPPLSAVLHRMAGDPFAAFSDTINVDCTILLALVSDLSHSRVQAEDWHHRAVLRQIEMERENQLLPNSLWPAMGSRSLVCTPEASKRMHEIVDLIGTESEKKRRDCLMEVEITAHWSRERRVREFQELSAYEVPSDWKIPITMVVSEPALIHKQLPPVAEEVAKVLSPINQSVFLYGWATSRTTISSNRTVAKEIESTVEMHRSSEDDAGPDIWLCPTARSLVGKEKNRRNWKG